jgi:hypothetical protein
MSSVVSVSVYGNDRPWVNGLVRRRYEVTLEDNDAVQHVRVSRPLKIAASDDGTATADRMLAGEMAREIGRAISSDDSLTLTLNPKWSTTKDMAKAIIYKMMKERDPYLVIQHEALLNYIRANYTGAQIANLLDITIAQVQKMAVRIDAILSDTATVKDSLAVFDANSEEL